MPKTPPRILVVEDEAIIAMSIERDLHDLGYEVAVANSGQQALDLAAQVQPNLALMDVVLGGEPDGVEAAFRLRRAHAVSSVFLTAYSDAQTFERAASSLPLGYLVKPYVKTELHYTLQLALRRLYIDELLSSSDTGLSGNSIAVDPHGTIRACGGDIPALAGLPESQLLDQPIMTVLPLADGAPWSIDRATGQMLAAEQTFEFWQSVIRSRNGVLGAMITLTPQQTPTGKVPTPPSAGAGPIEEFHEDSVTGLASRPAAESLIKRLYAAEGCYVGCFVLERFSVYRSRFGAKAVNDIMLHYGVTMGQHFSGEEHLFHWVGPSFVAVLNHRKPPIEAQRFLSMVACSRTEKTLRLPNRTVFVPITCRWTMLDSESESTPENLIIRLDSFVATELKRQGM